MTATERAKRSDALYYETVSVNRRVLCDMIANRESDLEELRAENAKLREQVASLTDRSIRMADELDFQIRDNWKLTEENDRLQSENAKLRELCADMYEMAYPECPSAFEAAFADRMRELGIEVEQ